MKLSLIQKIVKEELNNLLKENQKERAAQIKEMMLKNVHFIPGLQHVNDEVVQQIYNKWYNEGRPSGKTIQWEADFSSMKLTKFELN